jgi:hypothetical protein
MRLSGWDVPKAPKLVTHAEADFGLVITVEYSATVHDQIGLAPRLLGGHVGVLFSHPAGVRGGRDLSSSDPDRIP